MNGKNILKICGELCNLNRPIRTPEPNYGYFGETTANIDCKALFESTILDEPSNLRHPPKLQSISREFLNDYTMNGKVDIQRMHIKLVDNYGNLVNLNGSNWSLTIKTTHNNI